MSERDFEDISEYHLISSFRPFISYWSHLLSITDVYMCPPCSTRTGRLTVSKYHQPTVSPCNDLLYHVPSSPFVSCKRETHAVGFRPMLAPSLTCDAWCNAAVLEASFKTYEAYQPESLQQCDISSCSSWVSMRCTWGQESLFFRSFTFSRFPYFEFWTDAPRILTDDIHFGHF